MGDPLALRKLQKLHLMVPLMHYFPKAPGGGAAVTCAHMYAISSVTRIWQKLVIAERAICTTRDSERWHKLFH